MKPKYIGPFLHVLFIQMGFILLFSLIYYSILPQFTASAKIDALDYLDCVSLSTTIQAGIGLTAMQPHTHTSILITTIQQVIVILSSIYIVFSFTMGA
jgi:hypothetical protein